MSAKKKNRFGRIGRIGRIGRNGPGRGRRGSVYILVVAVLSVLVLLTLTLSYLSRMDLLASRNWSWAVQQRMAAVTGVPRLQKAAMRPREAGGPSAQNVQNQALQPLKLGLEQETPFPGARASTPAPNGASARITRADEAVRGPRGDVRAPGGLAAYLIEDEAAKININAVLPDLSFKGQAAPSQPLSGQNRKLVEAAGAVTETELANLIEQVAAAARLQDVDPRTLAHAIAVRRYGPDGRPGRAFTDDNANNGTTDALNDGIDNDRDGPIDEPDEALNATTHDGLDNNRNGVVDEPGESIAQDGLDNNRDGRPDDEAEAVDDPGEGTDDPRLPALGDDTPYAGLEELMGVAGMTPALYRALSPYLTTFSVGYAAFTLDERRLTGEAPTGFPQVDPNTARPEQIYQALRRRFPQAGAALLGQFTVNLIDRRDRDNLPTSIQVGAATYTGMEINPCINEVCPDPNYGENKDGQFVELYNPWSQTVNLSGWSLRGSGVQAPLQGTLPSGAYLVLTNDINNDNDPTPEDEAAEGSFYNVFHQVGSGPMRQLIEAPGLKLPARGGRLQLVNAEGAVVDEFAYGDGRNRGAAKSFQRLDPRLREAELKPATPLEANAGWKDLPGGGEEAKRALKIMEQWQNQPLRSPLDAMLVATAHADDGSTASLGAANAAPTESAAGLTAAGDGAGGAGNPLAAHAFLLPLLNASEADNLDARLVDCFRVGAVIPIRSAGFPPAVDARGGNPDEMLRRMASGMGSRSGDRRSQVNGGGPDEEPRCMKIFGRINLNTAPAAVIAVLPGMTNGMARRIVLARGGAAALAAAQGKGNAAGAADRTWWLPEEALAAGRWANLSDFIRDETLWEGSPLYDRLDAVYPFSQVVALHTLALRVVTASRPIEPPKNEDRAGAGAAGTAKAAASVPRRQSTVRAERIVTGDRGCVETVTFGFLGATGTRPSNPDAAGPAGARVPPLNLAAIAQQVETVNQRLAAAGHAPIAPVARRAASVTPRATPRQAAIPLRRGTKLP